MSVAMRALLCCALLPLSPLSAAERSPVVSTTESPVKAEQLGNGHWLIDFGKAAFGNISITPASNREKGRMTIHLGETLSGDRSINRKPAGTVRYQRHEVTLNPRGPVSPRLSWSPPNWMKEGFLDLPKECKEEVMPFRYAEIEGAPPGFSADQVKRVSWSVAFDEKASAFESSSPELNAVWDLCKHSIKATTFMGLYVDGDRERKPYEADVLINQLSHYCLDARYDTARLTHEYLLEKPTWPTEWRLQSVILAWHDFLWSGDDGSLRKNYATLKARAMITRRTPEGLFQGWNKGDITDIVDWPAGERDGYDMKPEVKTVVTAFHYRALVLLEKIALQLGKAADAKEFAAAAEATRQGVNARLWDEARGCYVDGLGSNHASAHANFFPLAMGLVPQDRVPKVAAFLKTKDMACSVYGAQFLLDALYDAGESEYALSLLSSRGQRSWLNMSEKVGSTITLEAWDPSLKPNLDWNHAWGAAPSNLIARKLMGIEPLEPGFRRFRVKPQTASLENARIKMPTPKGPIFLEIQGRDASAWQASLTVPAGTVAEFHVPHVGEVSVQGPAEATPVGDKNGRRILGLGEGRWKLSIKG
ncbi:alpha-L-rhamnosidase C-terminal domain-containing protein [Luteolibacter luteus]|uniref:alpha-L-rhamnosidase n=1 Tax=Luteolibacter luteus TaxID=2728835 RepID=A0A858RNE4_9BACT|nr:alpha-L-rhamnosidase C-terminal domain-containing protein [Luteolibacter luteus]QJE98527.1 family 78 glycoside hydrolase catalytic domain [Luteolibacter luteus]